MAIRSDITVDWTVNPRLITIASPSVLIVVQDIVDTLRFLEDSDVGINYLPLVDAAGKEDLGGGTSVGITAILQDAQIAFEARVGPGWTLCTITGGNLVAVDSAGVPIDPRFATAYVTVDRASSSSATLSDQDSLVTGQDTLIAQGVAQDVVLDELHKLQGLDASNPMRVTTTNRTVGSINLVLTGDGIASTLVTRTP